MATETEIEVVGALHTSQDKYTYFLLAAAATAIGFTVTQTRSAVLAWSLLPLAFAVISWGLSFYLGCRRMHFYQSTLHANANLLVIESGRHPG